jgi:hypothetical protein
MTMGADEEEGQVVMGSRQGTVAGELPERAGRRWYATKGEQREATGERVSR